MSGEGSSVSSVKGEGGVKLMILLREYYAIPAEERPSLDEVVQKNDVLKKIKGKELDSLKEAAQKIINGNAEAIQEYLGTDTGIDQLKTGDHLKAALRDASTARAGGAEGTVAAASEGESVGAAGEEADMRSFSDLKKMSAARTEQARRAALAKRALASAIRGRRKSATGSTKPGPVASAADSGPAAVPVGAARPAAVATGSAKPVAAPTAAASTSKVGAAAPTAVRTDSATAAAAAVATGGRGPGAAPGISGMGGVPASAFSPAKTSAKGAPATASVPGSAPAGRSSTKETPATAPVPGAAPAAASKGGASLAAGGSIYSRVMDNAIAKYKVHDGLVPGFPLTPEEQAKYGSKKIKVRDGKKYEKDLREALESPDFNDISPEPHAGFNEAIKERREKVNALIHDEVAKAAGVSPLKVQADGKEVIEFASGTKVEATVDKAKGVVTKLEPVTPAGKTPEEFVTLTFPRVDDKGKPMSGKFDTVEYKYNSASGKYDCVAATILTGVGKSKLSDELIADIKRDVGKGVSTGVGAARSAMQASASGPSTGAKKVLTSPAASAAPRTTAARAASASASGSSTGAKKGKGRARPRSASTVPAVPGTPESFQAVVKSDSRGGRRRSASAASMFDNISIESASGPLSPIPGPFGKGPQKKSHMKGRGDF